MESLNTTQLGVKMHHQRNLTALRNHRKVIINLPVAEFLRVKVLAGSVCWLDPFDLLLISGVMKMLSKKFAKNRRKSLQQGSFGSAILSPGYTPYTSTEYVLLTCV